MLCRPHGYLVLTLVGRGQTELVGNALSFFQAVTVCTPTAPLPDRCPVLNFRFGAHLRRLTNKRLRRLGLQVNAVSMKNKKRTIVNSRRTDKLLREVAAS